MRWVKLVGFSVLLLLAVSLGVRYDAELNNFNDIYIRGKDQSDIETSGYWLNSYKPISTIVFDYANLLLTNTVDKNQYGVETSKGGLPVYASVNDNLVEWLTNDGVFFATNLALAKISKVDVWQILSDPILAKPNGGVRGAVRLNSDRLVVLHTAINEASRDKEYVLKLAMVNLTEQALESEIVLGSFSIGEHFALGGGMVINSKADAIFTGIGSAAGTDDVVAGSKAQDLGSLFGKVVRVEIVHQADRVKLSAPTIMSSGHRNPQGMALMGDVVFSVEHGPMGGDELNIIDQGENYGWNIRSFGTKYSGEDGSYEDIQGHLVDPIFHFTPSIGISDVAVCPSIFVKQGYKPCLLVSALRDQSIRVVKLASDQQKLYVQSVERISLPARVRKVVPGTDSIYAFLDTKKVIKIVYAPR